MKPGVKGSFGHNKWLARLIGLVSDWENPKRSWWESGVDSYFSYCLMPNMLAFALRASASLMKGYQKANDLLQAAWNHLHRRQHFRAFYSVYCWCLNPLCTCKVIFIAIHKTYIPSQIKILKLLEIQQLWLLKKGRKNRRSTMLTAVLEALISFLYLTLQTEKINIKGSKANI